MQAVSSADTRGRWWANEARDAAEGRAARSKGDQAGRRWRRRRAVCGRHVRTCLHRSQQLCEATGEVTPAVHDNMEGTRPRRKALPARWPYQSDNVSISERCARAWFDRRSRAPWAGLAVPRRPFFSFCIRGHNIGRGWCGERRQEATPAGGVALVAENPP